MTNDVTLLSVSVSLATRYLLLATRQDNTDNTDSEHSAFNINDGISPEMASYAGKSKKLTKSDINEIFFNSDEEDENMTDQSSSDESEGEGLPPNLEALGNPEAEGPPSEGEMGDEVEEVSSTNWWDASAFTPPGPRVVFNETLSGVQTPSEDPTRLSVLNCSSQMNW